MMMAMLVAGIACLLAGLLAIGFGIPVNEFSFGNTLILAGAIAVCAGLIILSMWAAVRELKKLTAWIESGPALDRRSAAAKPEVAGVLPGPAIADDRSPEGLAAIAEAAGYSSAPPTVPWQEDAAARARNEAVPNQEPSPATKPRRNLMFSSMSRRERERAQVRAADPSGSEPQSTTPAASTEQENTEAPPVFGDTWPRSERSRSTDPLLQRRAGRSPSNSSEPAAARQPPAAPAEDQPAVTVLKSGVVDGMAYSLYSDGSIEAQMPEGMMRFASIDELRAHLDHRP